MIKTDSDYTSVLAEVEHLAEVDPTPGTADAERLELLALLLRNYEENRSPVQLPDPIDAIRFRMEQQELTQRNLVPYIGSPSKVSEVLARKRPLTLKMIRALHRGLGIPAKVLLQDRPTELIDEGEIDWNRFPVREMIKRGWIQGSPLNIRDGVEELLRRFLSPLGQRVPLGAFYKKSHVRSAHAMDRYALLAWTARIQLKALSLPPLKPYRRGTVTPEFMREVVKLSWSARGPLLTREYLENHGIPLIVEQHLPKTHLDGAAVMLASDRPIVGLTLRFDRLDNFWFCLMHELAHICLHLSEVGSGFFDDLEFGKDDDPREREADELAGETLVPTDEWEASPARHLRSPEAAQHLAEHLRIHPAIVAGRMRFASSDFRILNQSLGKGEVRQCFPETSWPRR